MSVSLGADPNSNTPLECSYRNVSTSIKYENMLDRGKKNQVSSFVRRSERVLDAGNMFNIDESTVDTVANEMNSDVNAFHPIMRMQIMCAYQQWSVVLTTKKWVCCHT